jgi:hypothetical protein
MDTIALVEAVREQSIDVFHRMFRAVELVQEPLNRALDSSRIVDAEDCLSFSQSSAGQLCQSLLRLRPY